MDRDIEKDLIEIECAIKSQKEKNNVFTMSVLQRCHKLVSELREYKNTGLTPEEILDGKLLTGWIPCSEKLPEGDGFYLATIDGGIVGEDKPFTGLAEFEKGEWIDDEEDYQSIIAWMLLPEPYKTPLPRYKSNFMDRFERMN